MLNFIATQIERVANWYDRHADQIILNLPERHRIKKFVWEMRQLAKRFREV